MVINKAKQKESNIGWPKATPEICLTILPATRPHTRFGATVLLLITQMEKSLFPTRAYLICHDHDLSVT